MDANRRFAELAGIEPEQRCSYATGEYYELYPDFSDPIEVLKVMRGRDDFNKWVAKINAFSLDEDDVLIDNAIPVDLLLTPGALRDKAIQWMEAEHEK
jgi:hypothetical protein